MSAHRYHPDVNDPPHAVLYDDCDRCAQHAEQLVSLDDHNLTELYHRALGDDWSGTGNEYLAMHELYRIHILMERLASAGVSV